MLKAVKLLPVLMTLIIICAAIYYRKSIAAIVSEPELLRDFILSYRDYAILIFLVLCSVRSLLLLPAGIYAIAAGMTFGTIPGMLLNCVGVTNSGFIAFLISRIAGRNIVVGALSNKLKNVEEKLKNQGTFYVTELRMIPIFPFDMVSYASGLTNIKTKDFIIGTFLGSLPGSFVYSYLGNNIYDIHSNKFFISICMVVIISLIPVLNKYVLKKG